MRTLTLLSAIAALTGCTASLTKEEAAMYAEINAKPTLDVQCVSGCTVQYTDPRDRAAPPKQTNGYDAAIAVTKTLVGGVTSIAPYAAVGAVAVEGIKNASRSITSSVTTSDISDSNNTATSEQSSTHTTTLTQTDSSTSQSHNPVSTATHTQGAQNDD